MFRRFDVVLGLVTTALGVIGVAFAVFGPATYSYGTNWFDAGPSSLLDQGLDTATVTFLAIVLVLAAGVTVGAYLHIRTADTVGAAILWASAIGLFVAAAITLPGNTTAIVPSALHTDTADSVGIGSYFMLPALMALATTLVSIAVHHTPGRPIALRPH